MSKKDIFKSIPYLPLSAVIFVIIVEFLSYAQILPPPEYILYLLEQVYHKFGLPGVFIASFLEGLVYLGLYFPGSMVIVLSLFVSGGEKIELLKIALVVALAFTITSILNYIFGRTTSRKKETKKTSYKFLFFSMLHPHFISFYFFNEGLQKNKPFKILIVPLFITTYIFLMANILYPIGALATETLGDPFALIGLMSAWFFGAFLIRLKKIEKSNSN